MGPKFNYKCLSKRHTEKEKTDRQKQQQQCEHTKTRAMWPEAKRQDADDGQKLEEARRKALPRASRGSATLPTPWLGTSGFRSYERTHLCYLSSCRYLLQRPREMDTDPNVTEFAVPCLDFLSLPCKNKTKSISHELDSALNISEFLGNMNLWADMKLNRFKFCKLNVYWSVNTRAHFQWLRFWLLNLVRNYSKKVTVCGELLCIST